jgi:hypothetical protein
MRSVACLLLAAGALMGGCYERTVSTRGIGGVGSTTQKEYRSNTAADRAMDSLLGRPRSKATKYDEVKYDEER